MAHKGGQTRGRYLWVAYFPAPGSDARSRGAVGAWVMWDVMIAQPLKGMKAEGQYTYVPPPAFLLCGINDRLTGTGQCTRVQI